MYVEDVDWLLRYPSDELVMHPEMLTRIQNAITACKAVRAKVIYHDTYDQNQRLVRIPYELADRKLTLLPEMNRWAIAINVKGEQKSLVVFYEH